MTYIVVRDISDTMRTEIERLAEHNGRTAEEEAFTLLEDALRRARLARILKGKGLGSALQEIGREFDITNEFEHLRSTEMPRVPDFE